MSTDGLEEAISRLSPAELVIALGEADPLTRGPAVPLPRCPALVTSRDDWEFDPDLAREELGRRFDLASLDGLGIGPDDTPSIAAAGALLRYLGELQPGGLPHLTRPVVRRSDRY